MSRIAIDAMGGDYAPRAIVEGTLWAAKGLHLRPWTSGKCLVRSVREIVRTFGEQRESRYDRAGT